MSEQFEQLARQVAEHVVAALAPHLPAQSRSPGPGYLCTRQVAEMTGISPVTLERYRARGQGPRFYRVEGGTIRYREADVRAWVEADPSDAPAMRVVGRKSA